MSNLPAAEAEALKAAIDRTLPAELCADALSVVIQAMQKRERGTLFEPEGVLLIIGTALCAMRGDWV